MSLNSEPTGTYVQKCTNNEKGKLDKILSTLWGKDNLGNVAKTASIMAKNLPSVLRTFEICPEMHVMAKMGIICLTVIGTSLVIKFEGANLEKSPEDWRFFAIFAIACISGHKWNSRWDVKEDPLERGKFEKKIGEFKEFDKNSMRYIAREVPC